MKNKDLEQRQRQAVVEEAKTWLRTPYHHMAQVKGAGVDCVTFLTAVYRIVGLVPEIAIEYYPQHWHLHRGDELYLGGLEKYARLVEEPTVGNIVIYKFGRCFSHGGIVLDWPMIIHAYASAGMVTYGEGDLGELAGREHRFYSLWGK